MEAVQTLPASLFLSSTQLMNKYLQSAMLTNPVFHKGTERPVC